MKPFYYIFLLSMVSCPIFGQSVLNADFEATDPNMGTGFQYWRSKMALKTARDENIRHAGQSSIQLQTPVGEQFVSFSQMIALPPSTSLRKYRISGFLKRDSVSQYAGIWVNVFAGDKSLFFNNMGDRALNGTADWIEISNDFFVDETATKLQIGGLIVGKGTAWFDDFSLSEIPLNQGPLPDTLHSYLTAAIDIIQKNALRRDSVAWPKVIDRAFFMASGANNYGACYPIISYVLNALGDHHSFLMPASMNKSWSDLGTQCRPGFTPYYRKNPGWKIWLLTNAKCRGGRRSPNHLFCGSITKSLGKPGSFQAPRLDFGFTAKPGR